MRSGKTKFAVAMIGAFVLVASVASAADDKTVRVCRPSIGAASDDVLRSCGKPLATYKASSGASLAHTEWDYGATMVGFVQDRVAYVLVIDKIPN